MGLFYQKLKSLDRASEESDVKYFLKVNCLSKRAFVSRVSFLSLAFMLEGCAILGSRQGAVIELSQKAYVTDENHETRLHKKGDQINLGSGAVLLESPGHMSMLIVPTGGESGIIKTKFQEASIGEDSQRLNVSDLQIILSEINNVQKLMSEQKAKEAFSKIETLQRKYPNVGYLNFYRAGSLYVLGDKDRAKSALEDALGDSMDTDEIRDFYLLLGGSLQNYKQKINKNATRMGSSESDSDGSSDDSSDNKSRKNSKKKGN